MALEGPATAAAILIVEDEPIIRMLAVDIAIGAGFEVLEAESADQAIACIEHRPDIGIIFTDIDIPGHQNGLALAFEIEKRWPRVAIIITSGKRKPAEQAMPSGAVFLPKPYPPRDLEKALVNAAG